ncbi:hypothetical protein ACOMHN_059633 [Nucella lapillus]
MVLKVFGDSLPRHLHAVKTLYYILQTRTDNLAYDLYSRSLGLGRLSCVFTWMSARPAVSDKVMAVLRHMFPSDKPDSTTPAAVMADNPANTTSSQGSHCVHTDDLSLDWTTFESGYSYSQRGYSGPDDLIQPPDIERDRGHCERYDDLHYPSFDWNCKPENLSPVTEMPEYEEEPLWM